MAAGEPVNSPLVSYALAGLDRCWLPERQCWSHIYHLDGRGDPNESVPHSDVFYTLNVLLGMARVPRVPPHIDVRAIFKTNTPRLMALPVPTYAFGVALWTAGELNLHIPNDVLSLIKIKLADKNEWKRFTAQDIGMILIGVIAQAKREPEWWSELATRLADHLIDEYWSNSALFFEAPYALRRRFSSFATQTYLTLACYVYGEFANDRRSIETANTCARKLISLQGPNGEWPWFFDSLKGAVLDFYEVYTVHQCGMAPAFLEHAERHGVPGARNALVRGFNWVLGGNQLGVQMLVPELQMTIRSQVRRGEMHTKMPRMVRAMKGAVLGRKADLIDRAGLELRLECRSYELGWVLWSFGQRADLPELTQRDVFL